MATTSKGLRYPTGSDAVAISTHLQNLAEDVDGMLNTTSATTKGDLTTRSATDFARLPVGANGTYLKANSSESTGLQWIKDFTTDSSINGSIASYQGNGSDTSVLFSSIPQTYDSLDVIGRFYFVSGAGGAGSTLVNILINGTLVNFTSQLRSAGAIVTPQSGLRFAQVRSSDTWNIQSCNTIHIKIQNYTSSAGRKVILASMSYWNGNNDNASYNSGFIDSQAAITSIEIRHASLYPFASDSRIEMYGSFEG